MAQSETENTDMDLEEKKAEDAAWNTKGVVGSMNSTGKRNVAVEQIPNLGSDSACHLSKAVAICIPVLEAGGLRNTPQMAAWPWCTLLLHNPDPGRRWERNKTPIKLQPIPLMGLPQICPINTGQPRVQFLHFEKGQ